MAGSVGEWWSYCPNIQRREFKHYSSFIPCLTQKKDSIKTHACMTWLSNIGRQPSLLYVGECKHSIIWYAQVKDSPKACQSNSYYHRRSDSLQICLVAHLRYHVCEIGDIKSETTADWVLATFYKNDNCHTLQLVRVRDLWHSLACRLPG